MILKHKILSIILVFFVLSTITPVLANSGFTYYVSALNGSDEVGNGTIGNPYKTIQKAANIMSAGDTCIIREGIYRETVTPANSGTAQKQITFMAYDNENVVISGTEKVENWQLYKDNIYVSNDMNWAIGEGNIMIFFNQENVTYAKWPSDSSGIWNNPYKLERNGVNVDTSDNWVFPTWAVMGDETERTVIYDENLNFSDDFFKGGTIVTPSGYGWYRQTAEITTSTNGSLTLDSNGITDSAYYNPISGNPYFITGILNALDDENEYFFDRQLNKLYLCAPGGVNPASGTVEAKKRRYAFNLSDKKYINIDGINFFASTVNMDNTDNASLNNISINYTSEEIYMSGYNNSLTNSRLSHSLVSHIKVMGKYNTVFNNLFEHAERNSSEGAVVVGGEENRFTYNTVRYCARSGIMVLGCAQAIIEHNDVSFMGSIYTDNGAIYAGYSDGVNTEVRYNVLHDGLSNLVCGMYIDNSSSNFVVHHNVTWNTYFGYLNNLASNNILVYNNTFTDKSFSNDYWIKDLKGDRFVNNIITSNSKLDTMYYDTWTNTEAGQYMIQYNNLFYDGALFENAALHNYSLATDSNAVDRAVVLSGINENYIGSAPDIGAYEYGTPKWEAGCNFVNPPAAAFLPVSDAEYKNHEKYGGFEGAGNVWEKIGAKRSNRVFGFVPNNPEGRCRTGNYGLMMGTYNLPGGVSGMNGIKQKITSLKPNTKYTLSAWAKTENVGDSITMGINGVSSACEKEDSDIGGIFKLSETQSGEFSEFILADIGIGPDGEPSFGLISRNAELNRLWLDDDPRYTSTDSKKYKSFTVGDEASKSDIDTRISSYYTEEMQQYMLDSVWNIGYVNGIEFSARGTLGLANIDLLEDNFEYLKFSPGNFTGTVSGNLVYWNSNYLSRSVYKAGDTGEILRSGVANGSIYYMHYMVYVDNDFFKNVKLELSSISDGVKKCLTNNFTRDDLAIYTNSELDSIGFSDIEATPSVSTFTNTTWLRKEIEFETGDSVGNVEIYFEKPVLGLGYIDDVSIIKKDSGPININGAVTNEIHMLTPEENIFNCDGKEFILLDSNSDGFFVMSKQFYDFMPFDEDGTQRLDVYDSNNISYWLNNNLEISENIDNYIDYNHIWFTEAANYKGNAPEDYCEIAGVSLLSYAEFLKYADKFGIRDNAVAPEIGWWLRNGEGTTFERSEMFYVNCFGSRLLGKTNSKTSRLVRPVFYLTRDFFKNVKLDVDDMGSNVKNMLTECFDVHELCETYTQPELYLIGFESVGSVNMKGNTIELGDRK